MKSTHNISNQSTNTFFNPVITVLFISVLAAIFISREDFNHQEQVDIIKDDYSPPLPLWSTALNNISLRNSNLVLRTDERYDEIRKVYNGECNNSPDVIVEVGDSEDVADIIKFISRSPDNIDISVRSGGHSYGCTSSRASGLQFDLRGLDKIQLLQTPESGTGWAADLGPGATWERVLSVVGPEQWTLVHGQCLSVGVGGFTLGGGVNMVGSTARYGAAMEQVIRYEMVTAAGEIVQVTEDSVKILNTTDRSWSPLPDTDPRHETDLLFGLRGAGASYGVVTQFLVTVYPRPETLASVIPVFVTSDADLRLIQSVAESGEGRGYQFGLYSLYYPQSVREPWYHPLLASSQHLLRLQAWVAGEEGVPMIISVADIRSSAGRRTNTSQVISLLTQAGVRLAISSHSVLDKVSQEAGALGMTDYEGEYLTEQQRVSEGDQGLVSANMGGVENIDHLSPLLLDDPLFGNKHKFSSEALSVGCNYCFWAVNFLTVPVRSPEQRISLTRDVGRIQMEMTCMYSMTKSNTCRREVETLREKMLRLSLKNGGKDSQYVNTPSCQAGDWSRRYFGDNYQKLLHLKNVWDPKNLFNYCQSIGNNRKDCCH